MKSFTYSKLVRTSAIYDLITTSAFVTPWTFNLINDVIGRFTLLPTFEPLHVLFVNLLGSVVVVWSIVRIKSPEARFGLYDTFARGLFFAWQINYLVLENGNSIVWFFAVFEFAFGVAQGYGYWLRQKLRSGVQPNCRVVRYLVAAA